MYSMLLYMSCVFVVVMYCVVDAYGIVVVVVVVVDVVGYGVACVGVVDDDGVVEVDGSFIGVCGCGCGLCCMDGADVG